MHKGIIVILVLIAFGIIYIKTRLNENKKKDLIKKYGETIGNAMYDKKVVIGMNSQMVRDIKNLPAKSDGKIIRENYTKEVLYYDEYKDAHQKSHYRLKVTFENEKVTEIREFD